LFGGAIAGSTIDYIQFLLPGMLILTVVPLTVYSGTSLCLDITKGIYNRFRTMPFWQPSSILGPLITDGMRYTIASLSVLATGFLLGFHPEGGILGTVLALLFIIFFAFSVSWIFAMIGVLAKRPETVSGSSMMFIYPLLFAVIFL
jgi:ABC-2 type transport system permease protein